MKSRVVEEETSIFNTGIIRNFRVWAVTWLKIVFSMKKNLRCYHLWQ